MAGPNPSTEEAVRAFLAWEEEFFDIELLRAVYAKKPPERVASSPSPVKLTLLAEQAASCTKCRLHEGRTRSVFSRGNENARVMFVGEGPGYHEDQKGLPFVGRAGQLLDKMIVAMKLSENDVYICNVVKCRPPDNRTPLPDEASACMPYLDAQIGKVAPEVIVALGRCAAEYLGCLEAGARGWRGRWTKRGGIDVMATYHPAFLLRNDNMKRPVWEDLQQVMRKLASSVS